MPGRGDKIAEDELRYRAVGQTACGDECCFVCVECGCRSSHLFRKHPSGIIKVSFCEKCEKTVDKYVLFDSMIIILDALLHKPQVYRHLLHNSKIPSPWKLFMIFVLCDAYLKWDNLHGTSHTNATSDSQIFYAALEFDFYRMSVVSFVELIIFSCVIILLFHIGSAHPASKHSILYAIVISSFGKLLTIPAVIWAQTHSTIYLWLTQLLVFTSNVTALKVLCGTSYSSTALRVAVAWTVQHLVGRMLTAYCSYE